VFQFCFDAALFLQKMEQYHRLNKAALPNKEPVIVVHCKAGKGRTGMMICSLLLFLGIFPSAKTSIDHYNRQRAVNMKALTICSQKRYVKFFEGFLNYKLTENVST
jgi:protein-tyrosine phosphatase